MNNKVAKFIEEKYKNRKIIADTQYIRAWKGKPKDKDKAMLIMDKDNLPYKLVSWAVTKAEDLHLKIISSINLKSEKCKSVMTVESDKYKNILFQKNDMSREEVDELISSIASSGIVDAASVVFKDLSKFNNEEDVIKELGIKVEK